MCYLHQQISYDGTSQMKINADVGNSAHSSIFYLIVPWHNEVLKIILDTTEKQVSLINGGKRPQKNTQKRFMSFVRPGQESIYKQKQTTKTDENWNWKWEIAADLPGKEKFFPIPTAKKPDIVVW